MANPVFARETWGSVGYFLYSSRREYKSDCESGAVS